MSWAEIGKALNSTIKDPEKFMPLDLLIQYNQDISDGKNICEYTTGGTRNIVVPVWAKSAKITACGGGGGGYASGGGGGGGGAAIVNSIFTIDKELNNTTISVVVGFGGSGAYYKYDDDLGDYAQIGPTSGTTTQIAALGMILNGGKGGSHTAGGESGGTGGGNGGLDGSGESGVSGAGGTGGKYNSLTVYSYGGGGGSLGAGGNGVFSATNEAVYGGNGSRGGGGGGCYSSSYNKANGGNGGSGYVKIEWLP